jgi:predicted Zn-dependent protease
VVFAAAVVLARPVYRLMERWQAANVLSQAQELARQQMFVEAMERLEVALKLNPSSAGALRSLAEIYSHLELPYALPVWRALLTLPAHTEEDVHGYIDLALRLQRFDLAEAELARLLARTNISLRTRIQASDFFFRQGDYSRALKFAEEIRRSEPANQEHQLRVARALLNLRSPDRQREGLQLLAALDRPEEKERLTLFHILAEAPALPRSEASELLQKLRPPQGVSAREYLLWSDARLRVDPEHHALYVAEAVQRYRASAPTEQAELGYWLNRVGAHDAFLAAIETEQAVGFPPLLTQYLEALARTGRWAQLQKVTANPVPLDAWILAAFRAVAATGLNQETLAHEHWRRAFEHVSGSSGKMRALGDLAFKLGAIEQAIAAFDHLTRDRLSRVTGYRRLAVVYERIGDTARLRTVMREWSAHVPDDPFPENAFCYLSGLMRRDVELASERAGHLLERLPRRVAYRTTLALLELRQDRPQAALQLYRRAPIEAQSLTPQARLIYAAVLNASGEKATARELIENLDPSRFLPEERELLERLRRGDPSGA